MGWCGVTAVLGKPNQESKPLTPEERRLTRVDACICQAQCRTFVRLFAGSQAATKWCP